MKNKIILFFSHIIVASIFCLIGFLIGINVDIKSNDSMVSKSVGVYYSDEVDKNENTLILNEDLSCKYPGGFSKCKWYVDESNIKIKFTKFDYVLKGSTFNSFDTQSACNEVLETVYSDIGGECVSKEITKEVILVDKGILLDGQHFEKIG